MRLPLDDNATVKAIVADRQVLHTDIEVVALAREIEERGVLFGRIDPKIVTYDAIAPGWRRPDNTFHDTDASTTSGLDMSGGEGQRSTVR